jgi:hypothetical protein
MSLVSEHRTSWNLTGDPSVFHNPANLPYEAVRRMWWTGFTTGAVLGLAGALGLFFIALVFDGRIVINAPAADVEHEVPSGPLDPGTVVRRVPLDAYDPPAQVQNPGTLATGPSSPPADTSEPGKPRTVEIPVNDPLIPNRLPDINPLFPESFPASPEDDPLRPDPLPPF